MNIIELIKDAVLLSMIALLSAVILYAGPSHALELNVGTGQRTTNGQTFQGVPEKTSFDFFGEIIQKVTKNTEIMYMHTSDLVNLDHDYGLNYLSANIKYTYAFVELKGGIGLVDDKCNWNRRTRANPVINFSIGAPASPDTFWRWSMLKSVDKDETDERFYTILFSIMYRIGGIK